MLLARALHAAGHGVNVCVFYGGGSLEHELSESGIPVFDLAKKGFWNFPAFAFRAASGLRRQRPDVVYSFLGEANILATLLKGALKPARLVWGIRSAVEDFYAYGWINGKFAELESLLSAQADMIIANSEAGRRAVLKRGFRPKRLVTVPNGLDAERFTIDPEARLRLRMEWEIAPHEVLVGRIGRIDPIKDFETFLKAAERACLQNPVMRFVCVGSGNLDYVAKLKRAAQELNLEGKILWMGECKSMNDVYNALDLVLSSSVSEGFPNVLLEGMACGVPCVSTEVGDAAEILGPHGLLVPARNPEQLADACLKLAQQAPAREAIRESVIERFSTAAVLERTLGHLARILPAGSASPALA